MVIFIKKCKVEYPYTLNVIFYRKSSFFGGFVTFFDKMSRFFDQMSRFFDQMSRFFDFLSKKRDHFVQKWYFVLKKCKGTTTFDKKSKNGPSKSVTEKIFFFIVQKAWPFRRSSWAGGDFIIIYRSSKDVS